MASDTASPLRSLLIGLAYAVGYGLLFMLGRYTIGLMEFSLWFPAAGLRSAALLIFGWRFALIAAVGELAAQGVLDEWSKWGDGFTIEMVCGVAGPPLIYGLVALVLQRSGLNLRPLSFRHTIWLLAAAIIAPALTAPVSTGFLHLADRLPLEAFWPATISFWVGDAVGIFMLAPVLVAIWLGRGWYQDQRRSDGELNSATIQRTAFIEIAAVLSVSIGLFILLGLPADPTFWYPVFLPVAVLSMRYHWLGAIPAIFTFNVMAAWVAAGLDEPTERLDLQVFLIVLSAAGLLMAATVRDRQRAEDEKRRQFAEFAHEDRRAALSDMASHIVHELSAPLSAASSFAQSGLQRIPADDPAKPALEKIADQTQRMTAIVQSVKRLARQQDGLTELIEVGAMLDRAASVLGIAAKETGCAVESRAHPAGVYVRGDAVQLEQAIINIGRNGIEAMGADPGTLKLAVSSDAGSVRISIKDQGPGLNEAQIGELFRPKGSSKADGMGVGLSLTKAIVEAHDGELSVESHPDQGTVFSIELPIAAIR